MSQQKWQRSSLRHLSAELKKAEHPVSHSTVRRLLVKMDYSLKANLKRLAGTVHPDRNRQFEYLEAQKRAFLEAGPRRRSSSATSRMRAGVGVSRRQK
jgi:hypothetical protein